MEPDSPLSPGWRARGTPRLGGGPGACRRRPWVRRGAAPQSGAGWGGRPCGRPPGEGQGGQTRPAQPAAPEKLGPLCPRRGDWVLPSPHGVRQSWGVAGAQVRGGAGVGRGGLPCTSSGRPTRQAQESAPQASVSPSHRDEGHRGILGASRPPWGCSPPRKAEGGQCAQRGSWSPPTPQARQFHPRNQVMGQPGVPIQGELCTPPSTPGVASPRPLCRGAPRHGQPRWPRHPGSQELAVAGTGPAEAAGPRVPPRPSPTATAPPESRLFVYLGKRPGTEGAQPACQARHPAGCGAPSLPRPHRHTPTPPRALSPTHAHSCPHGHMRSLTCTNAHVDT